MFIGILDSKAERRKESWFGRSSTRSPLFSRKQLLGGKTQRLCGFRVFTSHALTEKVKTQRNSSYQSKILHVLPFTLHLDFQLDIDVGSSTVARGVVSLVLGYLTNLVIEMAFLIQVKHHHPEEIISQRILSVHNWSKEQTSFHQISIQYKLFLLIIKLLCTFHLGSCFRSFSRSSNESKGVAEKGLHLNFY